MSESVTSEGQQQYLVVVLGDTRVNRKMAIEGSVRRVLQMVEPLL